MLKWRSTCSHCKSISDIGEPNGKCFHYTHQAGYDHLIVRCLHCGGITVIWKIDADDVATARTEGFLFEDSYPPGEVIRRYNGFFNLDPQPRFISARVERLIAFEAYGLDRELAEFSV